MAPGGRGRGRSARRPAMPVDPEASEETPIVDPIPATVSKTVDLSRIPVLAKSVKDRLTLFHGGSDPWLAQSWLKSLSDTFAYISCSEAERVELARYHLRDQAVTWWETQQTALGERVSSWTVFREAFERQYFSEAFCQTQQEEFMNLKQGSRSVTDYHTEFSRLAEFCPQMVVQDKERLFHFTRGLAPYIRSKMSCCVITTFREALDRALIIESTQQQLTRERDAGKAKEQSSRSAGQKRSAQGSGTRDSSTRQKGKRSTSSSRSGQKKDGTESKCYRCGSVGHRVADCPSDEAVCYYCKQPGHLMSDCPRRAQLEHTGSSSGGQSTQTRQQRVPTRHRGPQRQKAPPSAGQLYQIQGRDYIVYPADSQPEICYAAVPMQQRPPAVQPYVAAPQYIQQPTSVPPSQIHTEWRPHISQTAAQPPSTEIGRAYAVTREDAQRADGLVIRGAPMVTAHIMSDELSDLSQHHSSACHPSSPPHHQPNQEVLYQHIIITEQHARPNIRMQHARPNNIMQHAKLISVTCHVPPAMPPAVLYQQHIITSSPNSSMLYKQHIITEQQHVKPKLNSSAPPAAPQRPPAA